jgi:ADP-heptose:LPS heptosyltransferase
LKKVIVCRLGAIGDCIIITPVIKKLKEMGYYIIFYTSKRGQEVFKDDPRIDEMLLHDDSIPIEDVQDCFDKLEKEIKHDLFINFTESIECNVAVHPVDPLYNRPKWEREVHCNKNYYDVTEQWAKLEGCDKTPSLHITEEDDKRLKAYIKKDKFNILWCMSGSGKNKVYPWADYVIGEILKDKDVHVITVGDLKCQILENILKTFPEDRITELAGKIPIKDSLMLTKHVNLVISPDTGVLHASGCFATPKIGLLGHTTKENITKYFINDYSIEAECPCAPCYRLIYDYDIQCPLDVVVKSAWCMSQGIQPERVYERYKRVRQDLSS